MALTLRRAETRHGSPLAHKAHIFSPCPCRVSLAPPLVAIGAGGTATRLSASGSRRRASGGAPRARPARRRFHRAIDRPKRIRAARRAAQRRQRREAFATLPGGVSLATLEAIASCESGGDPTIVSSDGTYRGKYQFSYETWASVGGCGDPAAAPEAEQDYRAALLYSRLGLEPLARSAAERRLR